MQFLLIVNLFSLSIATPIIYRDQTSFLNALAQLNGVELYNESFESSEWDAARHPLSVESITVNGITWSSGELISTNLGWARTGNYGIFDNVGDPDRIYSATSDRQMYAVGAFFRSFDTPTDIKISLDGDSTGMVYTDEWVTYYRDSRYFGVIDLDGFTSVSFEAELNNFGSDDYSFALAPRATNNVPESSILSFMIFGFMLFLFSISCRQILSRK